MIGVDEGQREAGANKYFSQILEYPVRYRDLARESDSFLHKKPENTVLLHVRRGEMPRLACFMKEMDIHLYGSIRRMPTGNVFVQVACRDTATASALLERW